MDITILKKLGLTDKELNVYLKLLEYGAISVRSLAELTGLNRGTTYDVLKRLQEIGLVSYYVAETKQKFIAEDTDKLMELVRDKEDDIIKIKERLSELIPELKSLQDKNDSKPATKLYEGKKGIKFILDDVLTSVEATLVKEYYLYSAKQASEDWKKAYPNFTNDRIKKKVKVKVISLAQGGGLHGLDERRWLGTNDESATFIFIYNSKCAFVSRDANGSPVGVIIENKMIYETQKIIFLKLWELLK
ncbi:MAG: helix-turn-helix domain-containing protein [Patescibacteria group bacterium]